MGWRPLRVECYGPTGVKRQLLLRVPRESREAAQRGVGAAAVRSVRAAARAIVQGDAAWFEDLSHATTRFRADGELPDDDLLREVAQATSAFSSGGYACAATTCSTHWRLRQRPAKDQSTADAQ